MILQSVRHLYLLLKLGYWGTQSFSWILPLKEKYTNNIRFVFPIYYVIEHVMSLNAFTAKKKKARTILEGLIFSVQTRVRLTRI